jgi:uncharacterized membrane protein YeaQ/YmgE (transglycosylase-associated protein family)
MVGFIVVFLVVGFLAKAWASEHDLEGGSGWLFAIIIGLFAAVMFELVIMRTE